MKNSISIKSFLTPCLIGSGLMASAAAQANLDAWTTQVGPAGTLDVRVTGDPGHAFAVLSSPVGDTLTSGGHSVLASGRFDALGNASLVRRFGTARLPANFGVDLHLVTRNPTSATGMDVDTLSLALSGNGGLNCHEFDPNYSLEQRQDTSPYDQIEPVAGQRLFDEWVAAGMTISATNNTPGHPDVACIFDSGNPTGGDTDLATPGYGLGNDMGGPTYGNVIIIAEEDTGGALIAEPDDEELGGTIRFDFAEPYHMCSATLLDIDQDEFATSELRFYIGDAMAVETVPMEFQGDNSLQTLTFDKRDVRAFEVVLAGSGAIARLEMTPCPVVLNFDETPFGKPHNLAAGTTITNQFADIGLNVSVVNLSAPGEGAMLFDSLNPTGGDEDLRTPSMTGGLGNDSPLGMVLVLPQDNSGIPNDGADGGIMTFTFDEPITFVSAKVLDVDAMERDEVRFYNDLPNASGILDPNSLLIEIDIESLGENSVQEIMPMTPLAGVRTITVTLTGSGALADLRWCPESNGAPMP